MVRLMTAARGKPRASARLIFPAFLLLVFPIGGHGSSTGGEVKAGPQFLVSDVTSEYEYENEPSVAADAQGNFVVVWRESIYGPPYGSQIQARLFASDGTPRGGQFQVGDRTTGYVYERAPSVAADADGDFVVVWHDYQYPGPPYGLLIQGRRFASDGTPRSDPFQVSDFAGAYNYEFYPSVAADAGGDFVVVWMDYDGYGARYGYQIQGRQFAADGTPGDQFQVSSRTTGYAAERSPSVAADAAGDFVVVWDDYQYPGPPYGLLIQGRRFAASGTPRGGQYQVSDITAGYSYELRPSVAAGADGDFVVVWQAYDGYGARYGYQIHGRQFGADGTPGDQFKVSSRTTGFAYEWEASVAASADSDFVVVWREYQYPGPPEGVLIQSRRFASDGTPSGDQFQVSDTTTGYNWERDPAVAVDASGDFVVVWRDYQDLGPPYGYLIQGRQFSVGIKVAIDIMPSDPGNNLNLRAGKGATISVAILSVDDFDAPNRIDPSTLMFGPRQANIWGSPRARDMDGDGDDDLLVKFLTQNTGIPCGDTRANLSGRTLDQTSISGSDAINTFNCPRIRKRH
jgi:hypothetical protein